MTVDVAQFHQVFFEESLEHLDAMESGLLELGKDGDDPELVNVIFRGAHSIKGGAGTFGFKEVAEFTHLMETLLDQLRSGESRTTSEITSTLLDAVDVLRDMIDTHKSGNEPDVSRCEPVCQRLQKILDGLSSSQSRIEESSADKQASVSVDSSGWRIHFKPFSHFFRTGNDPYRILRELGGLGRLEAKADISAVPDFNQMDPEDCFLSWVITLHDGGSREEIDEIFAWVDGDCELIVEPLVAEKKIEDPSQSVEGSDASAESVAAPPVERRQGADRRSAEGESIRVGIEKIDAIINMVGELVITQSMLSQVGEDVHELNSAALESLRDGLAQLERNTRELQEGVMRIRMLPISFAFSRFPRLVHDLSNKLGKKVELKLSGEQTELDKTVMEKIGDPLVHLVRNSLDHGIEMPEKRVQAGKPEAGIIHLNAYHQGGNVIIEISDDGAGLDKHRIEAKAKSRGLISNDAELEDERVLDLIFEPGFSTAESVSDVSGRGVGMDVVRRNIRDLGGNVELNTKPGQGTKFTIRLPLTLAILDGQLVRVGDQVYVVPLVSIVESLQMQSSRVNALANCAEVYRLRNEYIPIMDLHRVFAVEPADDDKRESLLVVVEGEGKKVGLTVDDLLGQQQVVIKSLESNYRQVAGISGATILGDGTVALILDAARLVNMSCQSAAKHRDASSNIIAA